MGEQGQVLKDHADLAVLWGSRLLLIRDRITGQSDLSIGGLLKSCDGTQKRSLASAAWAQKAADFASSDREADTFDYRVSLKRN